MPTTANDSKVFVVDQQFFNYSVPAEVLLTPSATECAEPMIHERQNLEQNLIFHLSATRTAVEGHLRAMPISAPIPKPFQELRKLEFDWDGHRSEPPTEALIRKGEELWSILEELGLPELPSVKAGADGFLAFSWLQKYPAKHLEISLYERELDDFYCDWYLRKEEDTTEGSSDYPWGEMREVVIQYFNVRK